MEPTEQITADIVHNIREWIAEGEHYAQVDQNDESYWEFVCEKIQEQIDRAYDLGWHEATGEAMRICNSRAEHGNDDNSARANEARKCALQIEAVMVTNTMPPTFDSDV